MNIIIYQTHMNRVAWWCIKQVEQYVTASKNITIKNIIFCKGLQCPLNTIDILLLDLYTVVPLMRDHKESLQKRSLKRGLPYLVGNQELKPLVPLPDYPPNKANPF